jgi:hypothetical protein
MRKRIKSPAPTRRVARVTRARSGFFLGLLILAGGVWMTFGPGPALIVFGAGVVAYWVLLYDVDEPDLIDAEAEVRLR